VANVTAVRFSCQRIPAIYLENGAAKPYSLSSRFFVLSDGHGLIFLCNLLIIQYKFNASDNFGY
jgi:hypothetical protein